MIEAYLIKNYSFKIEFINNLIYKKDINNKK